MISGSKILVIRLSSIGDVVLTSPVVRCLKEQGDCEIHFLIKEQFSELVEVNPNIDKVWKIKSSISEVSETLKKENFNYIIDLHNNLRSGQLKNRLRAKSFTLKKQNINKWILVNTFIDKLPDKHVVDRYMDTVEPLGITNDDQGLDFYFPNDFSFDVTIEKPFVVAVIGGQHEGKKLPLHKWSEVFKGCDHRFVIIGGKEDLTAGEELALQNDNVINLCGETTIFESAKIVEQSAAVITNDTGMMHIASAFKKIIISLWGQTTPRFGMYPYQPDPRSVIIEPIPIKRRLSKLGNRTTRPHVMEKIDSKRIVETLTNVLAEQTKP